VPSRPRGEPPAGGAPKPAAPAREGAPWRPLVASGGVTDVGKLRKHNEDFILVRPDLGLFVVADGMGGHNAGDVASKLAAASVNDFFEATATGPVPGEPTDEDEGLTPDARRLAVGVRKANSDVHEVSSTNRQHRGMGSTMVALFVPASSGFAHVAHVGDSRCYRFREGKLEQLTRDHSLINDALELKPDLTPAELARLPKNIITRALGMKDAVLVDVRTEALRPGDTFLLCSDGLSGPVKDPQIHEVLAQGGDVHDMCVKLVALANDGGGNDNISAIVVRADAEEVELELVEVDELLSSAPPPDPKVATSSVRKPPPPPPSRAAAPPVPEAPAAEPARARPSSAPPASMPSAGEAPTRPERPHAIASLPRPAEPAPLPPPPARKIETPVPLPMPALERDSAPAILDRSAAIPRAAVERTDAIAVTFDDVPEVDPAGLLIPIGDAPELVAPVEPPEVDPTGLLIPIGDAAEPPEVDPTGLLLPIEDKTIDFAPHPPVSAKVSSLDRPVRYKVARCQKCDAELVVGTFFCVECGTKIG
jgi:protein phosphatase